ncbi:MAG: DUF748 domain-containing protein, partial [Gammaproteobacteria bacterium]|nr:DUF748 domain-containing protein [Gammaproteobacteria bacterium]
IEGADLSLRDVGVRSIDSEHSDREIVSVPELRLSGGRLQWPENTLSIDAVAFSEPVLHVWSEANGELNLTGLVAEQSADAGSDNDESNQNEPDNKSQVANDDPLTVSIGKLQISGMQADFIDYSLAAPAPIGLQNAQLTISNISTRSDSNATLELTAKTDSGGTIGLAGDLSVSPTVTAALTFQLDEFALSALQPWAAEAATVTVAGGSLSLNGRLRADANGLRVERTAATIAKLQVNDARGNEKLAGWQRLQVADISLATKERRIGIGDIKLNAPFGKLQINRDGSTNFSNLTKPATDENRDDSAADAPPYRVRVGQSVVSDGRLDFSDDSLPLPFSALITEFGGTVSAFASDSGDLSSLDLSGKVGDFGQSRVTGEVNLIDPTRNADIKAEFRNVSMPETSPYTVEFVGRKIAEGKLDLDLRYQFENRKVKGDNDVTLRDFKLGEKVPHDDAMDLPLGLAVGLLRDVDGVIKMDLKVSGDLDDPSFSARNLILKAFANLITRVAATPFKLLGALVPELGSDNANRIGFDPGSAVVLPPAQEQLQQIAVALDKRPDLLLRVPGGTDAELDTAALQAASGTVSVTPAQLAELGSRRQQALIETLRNYGIADERLTPGGDSANAGPDGLVELELGIEVN